MRSYPHILARAIGVPLAFHPGKVRAIADFLLPQLIGGSVRVVGPEPVDHTAGRDTRSKIGTALASGYLLHKIADELGAVARKNKAGKLGNPLGRAYEEAGYGDELVERHGPLGIVRIEGSLINKGAWLGSRSGDTSYEGVQAQVMRAASDRSIKAIVYEIDSFGGEVAGLFETADLIAATAEKKKSVAVLTDFGFSAAYALAAAAGTIVMPETGGAGSIGAVTLHIDFSKQLTEDGIQVTVLSSGRHKADGNPFEPLGAEVAARIRADLDSTRDLFAETVGRYRGRRMNKQQALDTEALDFRGPEALAIGLVDGVMPPMVAYQRFMRAALR
ncbi:MAG: S49 family peptidase [Beijerinckiaceae bacterium]